MSQREFFPDEFEAITSGKPVSPKSPLWILTPQMGADGLLRIYGRLNNSDMPDETKHPIILHRKSKLAHALAQEAHETLCHGGVQLCTQFLRNRYWIIGVRILLRTLVYKCITCTRYRDHNENQFMADLPLMRIQPATAFEHTGVDYAGPIKIKYS